MHDHSDHESNLLLAMFHSGIRFDVIYRITQYGDPIAPITLEYRVTPAKLWTLLRFHDVGVVQLGRAELSDEQMILLAQFLNDWVRAILENRTAKITLVNRTNLPDMHLLTYGSLSSSWSEGETPSQEVSAIVTWIIAPPSQVIA